MENRKEQILEVSPELEGSRGQAEKVRSPSIPLNPLELKAVAGVRLAKQYNKRMILIVVPAVVMAIAGVAFHKGQGIDVGFMVVAVAMAGFLAGTIVVSRWMERAKNQFVKEHAGAFWRKKEM